MVVLDSSVILKWFRPESASDRALRYKDTHLNRTDVIYCPDLAVYDASYIALAATLRCDLVTADAQLVRATKLPFVKLL